MTASERSAGVCEPWCTADGSKTCNQREHEEVDCWGTRGHFCSEACRQAGRPLNPPANQTGGAALGEMTLAEACEAKLAGKTVQFHKGEHGIEWHGWDDRDMPTDLTELAQMASNRYRLAPPAQPVPRARELARLYCQDKGFIDDGGIQRHITEVTESAVREVLEYAEQHGFRHAERHYLGSDEADRG